MEQNYTYIFNICGTISGRLPKSCAAVTNANTAGALQIDTQATYVDDDDWCYIVGKYNEGLSYNY